MTKGFFKDVDSLKRAMHKGRDYRIRTLDRNAHVTVAAPHGGLIEQGTSALVLAIAGDEHNLFDFQGLLQVEPFRLHVTSHHFREPMLTRLLNKSDYAVSIHGMPDDFTSTQIWLGGLNIELRCLVHLHLTRAGFSSVFEPPKYKGVHVGNFVNLPALHGVQLELPLTLRKRMFDGKLFCRNGQRPNANALFDRFVNAVRGAIHDYEVWRT